MANVITRWVRAVYDRAAGKKVEAELQDSLTSAGKKGGEGFLKELRTAFATRMADLKTQLARGLIDPAEVKARGGEQRGAPPPHPPAPEFLKARRPPKEGGKTGEPAGGPPRLGIHQGRCRA